MKKLILVFAVVAITAGAYAQPDSANRKIRSPEINNTKDDLNQNRDRNNNQNQNWQKNPVGKSHSDGVVMQNGKLMKVKNGELTVFEDDMTLSNGTKITSDGNYIKKDGSKTMLKEGQHIDMSGNVNRKETDKDRNMYLVPDSTKKSYTASPVVR